MAIVKPSQPELFVKEGTKMRELVVQHYNARMVNVTLMYCATSNSCMDFFIYLIVIFFFECISAIAICLCRCNQWDSTKPSSNGRDVRPTWCHFGATLVASCPGVCP